MPMYQYQAYDFAGKKKNGYIEAHNELEAKSKLREQSLMIAKLSLKEGGGSSKKLKGDDLLAFTFQLSQLLGAGVPLYEALIAIEEQYRNESFHSIILSLCDQIKAGTPLSEAMQNYPDSFNRLYCSMVRAGESVGALDLVLEKLSLLLNKQQKLRKEITTAMIYPAVLACFALLVICLLLGFVVPSIEGIFADKQLNGFTQAVLAVSHFFRDYWWLYLPVVALTIFLIVIKLRTPSGKLWLERQLLTIPGIRNLVIQAAVSRFCRTMATLQNGGVTMIDSLRIARETMRNATLEEEIKRAESKIIEGSSLSAQLMQSKYFPHMVSRMLAVGEDSGSSVIMMNKIADMYEDELEKTLSRVMALAQPVILIVMGTVIGAVMMAVLLPLTDVSSFSM
ncbi:MULTISPECIES: type II secretion system F family protein [Parachlamydia]|jgi:general secretion pathway protein F/type IV pilus assembly protein PilC|uniref:General secretion pathway protein F n=2 Tax=Parachlamydia acanthamoebae TaxID=83552 RepID=F8KXN2_PARAV|nr:type II secretion system F family protein [Parachlamydia acanthamoebae]KIA76801.1 Type II secretion system protein F [Parachlamydia acanthamoebae]CCB87515.1 general secretion pathway protein F [Parachlamydia acanthamoebae UV-7]